MSRFTDRDGREWTLDINIDSLDVVYSITGVSLYELSQDNAKPLAELLDKPAVLAHVCYILCDAEAKGVEQRAFARSVKGPHFEQMTEAFLEELMLFYPAARRQALTKLLEVGRSLRDKAMVKMSEIPSEKLADELLTQILSNTSGSLQASLASTPAA